MLTATCFVTRHHHHELRHVYTRLLNFKLHCCNCVMPTYAMHEENCIDVQNTNAPMSSKIILCLLLNKCWQSLKSLILVIELKSLVLVLEPRVLVNIPGSHSQCVRSLHSCLSWCTFFPATGQKVTISPQSAGVSDGRDRQSAMAHFR